MVDVIDIKNNMKKIDKAKYLIPKEGKMNTDATLFLTEKLLNDVESEAIQQIKNVTTLPGILGNALAMPDMHSGYGFPIGGVAAFDYDKGIISPGGIGFDLNCGVRLLSSDVSADELKHDVLKALFNAIPSGVGSETKDKLEPKEFENVALEGVDWAVKNGFAEKEDKNHIEDYGKLPASVDFISQRAIARGRKQIGTLGSGNHFTEVQVIDKIYDKELAEKWNLKEGNICIMIHTGSRGFGHQIATDFIGKFLDYANKNKIELVDQQLACVPIKSEEGQQYLKSMNAAANFAYVNRQMITHNVRNVFSKYNIDLKLLYDVAHNIAKKESYKIEGKLRDVLVHRKGATRAFAKGNKLLPEDYISTGQPVILPGSMGTYSYVLVGDKAEELSFGSVAHGAGRVMSRHTALKNITYEQIESELKKKHIEIMTASRKGLIEEAPEAYKDVDDVVSALEINRLAKPVVRLKPLQVIKG